MGANLDVAEVGAYKCTLIQDHVKSLDTPVGTNVRFPIQPKYSFTSHFKQKRMALRVATARLSSPELEVDLHASTLDSAP